MKVKNDPGKRKKQDHLSESQWDTFDELGYLELGPCLNKKELSNLSNQIDRIMLGEAEIDYSPLLMQLDSKSGEYDDAGEQTLGHKGKTVNYRKIQGLENVPFFREYTNATIFENICAQIYGDDVPISCFRAIFMNKPSGAGTLLPWHQDYWDYLDRDPSITVWTALDAATVENGCMEIIPGSHHHLIVRGNENGYLEPEQIKTHCQNRPTEFLEVGAGEAVLLHPWLLHRSGVNSTKNARRAFSVSYMETRTRDSRGQAYTRLF